MRFFAPGTECQWRLESEPLSRPGRATSQPAERACFSPQTPSASGEGGLWRKACWGTGWLNSRRDNGSLSDRDRHAAHAAPHGRPLPPRQVVDAHEGRPPPLGQLGQGTEDPAHLAVAVGVYTPEAGTHRVQAHEADEGVRHEEVLDLAQVPVQLQGALPLRVRLVDELEDVDP